MKKLLFMIDICSTDVNLRIDGETKKKSMFGGLLSLAIFTLTCFAIFFLGIDIIKRKNPRLIISEEISEKVKFMEISAKNYMLGFKVVDVRNVALNVSGYLDVLLNYNRQERKSVVKEGESPWNITNIQYLDYINCLDVPEYKSLNISVLGTFKCPKDFKFDFGGLYSESTNGFYSLKAYPCKPDPKNPAKKCKSIEEITKYVDQNLWFIVYYMDTSVNPIDNNKHIVSKYGPIITPISNLIYTRLNFYYSNLEIKKDVGFLFEDFRYENNIKYNSMFFQYSGRSEQSNYFESYFYLYKDKVIYQIAYLKVQEILANVGGLFKFLNMLGVVILYPISSRDLDVDIMNELFDFSTNYKMLDEHSKSINDLESIKRENSKNQNSINLDLSRGIIATSLKSNIEKMTKAKNRINANNDNNQQNYVSSQNNLISESTNIMMLSNVIKPADILSMNNINNIGPSKKNMTQNSNIESGKAHLDLRNNPNTKIEVIANNFGAKDVMKAERGNKKDIAVEDQNRQVPFNVNENYGQKDYFNDDQPERNNEAINKIEGDKDVIAFQEIFDNTHKFFLNNLKTVKQMQNKLEFNLSDHICLILCPFNSCRPKNLRLKEKQYSNCTSEINRFTNINKMVKNIKDLDYLKYVMLSKEQTLAFEFIDKPLISSGTNSKQTWNKPAERMFFELTHLDESKKIDMISSYVANLSRNKVEFQDLKILELVNLVK